MSASTILKKVALPLLLVALAVHFGVLFSVPTTHVSAIWPANAFLLAILLGLRGRMRWATLLTATHVFLAIKITTTTGVLNACLFTAANLAEVLCALTIIHWVTRSEVNFARLAHLGTLLLAIIPATAIGAAIGCIGVANSGGPLREALIQWWASDFVGFVVALPVAMMLPRWLQQLRHSSMRQRLEIVFAFAALFVTAWLAYGPSASDMTILSAHFIPVTVMLWIVLRFRSEGAAAACAVVALIAIYFAIQGQGPFSVSRPEIIVPILQLFLVSMTLGMLCVAALASKNSQELDDSRNRYRLIMDSVPDCIHELDMNARLTSMNAAGLQMLGVSDESEIRGQDYLSIPREQDRPAVNEAFYAARLGEYREFSFSAETNEGTSHFRSCLVPVRDTYGNVTRIVGVTQDVTSESDMENALRQAQKMQAIGSLTAGVAHDFNNILSAILGHIELLELRAGEFPQQYIETIKQSVQRGASLTRRLTAFAGQTSQKPTVTDVSTVISETLELLGSTLGEDVLIRCQCEPDAWPVFVDPHSLEDVLINLASNAREAMPNGGDLTIEVENHPGEPNAQDDSEGDFVRIVVTDTGKGIPPDDLDRVVEPFFTTKTFGRGSGLGLSIVHGFVQQSDGKLTIESEAGAGTSVSILLPRANAADETHSLFQDSEPKTLDEYRVLVVEDDADVRSACVAILRDAQYVVVAVGDGAEALEQLGNPNANFDLLFTDIVLPGGIDGAEIARQARQMNRHIRVIYTTGYSESAKLDHLELDPSIRRLDKPYGRAELLTATKEVLQESRQRIQ